MLTEDKFKGKMVVILAGYKDKVGYYREPSDPAGDCPVHAIML